MKVTRLTLAMLAANLVCAAHAGAQTPFPSRPIRMLVPFSPGGASDTAARVVGQAMGPRRGQQRVIESRDGARGVIGTEVEAKATPDGYTLLMSSNTERVIHPNLYRKRPYNTLKDFTPISRVANTPL